MITPPEFMSAGQGSYDHSTRVYERRTGSYDHSTGFMSAGRGFMITPTDL